MVVPFLSLSLSLSLFLLLLYLSLPVSVSPNYGCRLHGLRPAFDVEPIFDHPQQPAHPSAASSGRCPHPGPTARPDAPSSANQVFSLVSYNLLGNNQGSASQAALLAYNGKCAEVRNLERFGRKRKNRPTTRNGENGPKMVKR